MTGEHVTTKRDAPSLPGATLAEVMAAVLDRDVPFRFTAPGHSMAPFIRDGDVVTIAPARIRLGDVVAYLGPDSGQLTVHRVVRVARDGYHIKGDNAADVDACVEPSRLIGRVTRVEHGGQRMRVGLGIERVAIAFLSRRGPVFPMLRPVWRLIRPFVRRSST